MPALDGIRVIEAGLLVQGPQAAALLGDWGADVVKIEQRSEVCGGARAGTNLASAVRCRRRTGTLSGGGWCGLSPASGTSDDRCSPLVPSAASCRTCLSGRTVPRRPLPPSLLGVPAQERRRRLAALVAIVAAVVAGVLAYRGIVSFDGGIEQRARTNALALLDLERRSGIAVESDLQRSWLGQGLPGAVLTAAYGLLYWPFLASAAVITFWRHRPSFRLLRNAIAISGAIGLVVIVAFPVAPPRLLPGFDDHMAAAPLIGSLAHPSGIINPYAAMPSFHVGWVLVGALALGPLAPRWWRMVPPAAMSIAVVTTGNHFVVDVLAGLALGSLAWWLASPMQRALVDARREARRHGEDASDATCRPIRPPSPVGTVPPARPAARAIGPAARPGSTGQRRRR